MGTDAYVEPRPELIGYAAVDIFDGMGLEIEHVDEDGRVWLRPLAVALPDDTPMHEVRRILDSRIYGSARADAAAGEPVIGVMRQYGD